MDARKQTSLTHSYQRTLGLCILIQRSERLASKQSMITHIYHTKRRSPHRGGSPILTTLVASALLFCAYLPSTSIAQSSDQRRLGTNLTSVTDYSPQLPFIDLFKISRSWFTQCTAGQDPGCTNNNSWDTGEAQSLDLDSSGWVRSLPSRASAPIFTMAATYWDVPAQFPAGRYVVRYEGEGTIEYGLGAAKDTSRSTTRRDVVSVDPSNGGILLRITSTDPNNNGNYIRNISVVRESDEELLPANTFSASFLSQLYPYQALRFMDWMRTNDSSNVTWGGRALSTDARYSTDKGVPAEVMINLANTTGKAPWFTLPHQADDTYIQSFAALARATLRADLPVYVEYSNEVWNDAFSQGSWVQARGEAAWPGGTESGFTKRINYYGRRAAEICDLWKAAFSGDPGRVVCVVASQAANSWTASEALSCPLWNQGPCVTHGISALAIAPYMGDYIGQQDARSEVHSWAAQGDGGLSTLFSELRSGSRLSGGPAGGGISQSFGWIEENKGVADANGIALVTYEGGQHLVGIGSAGNDESITTLFTNANRDARMGDLYNEYLSGWNNRGGGLFMHFTDITEYSKYGSWGALERIGQTSSPKYNALWRYSTGTEPPSSSHTLTVRRVGSGRVTSKPAGISCGRACSIAITDSTAITLIARASSRSRFHSWSGSCRHNRPRCVVRMSKARTVRARFTRR
ncbi:MAG: hypothetical protein RL326_269 [Pseudomonadota bacterium]